MHQNSKSIVYMLLTIPLLILLAPSISRADFSLIRDVIISYNLKALQNSIENGAYRGEEGILRIKPETGKTLGLKVYIDKDYSDAKQLIKKAEANLNRAKRAMATKRKEKYEGEHIKTIFENFLKYQKDFESAKGKFQTYHANLEAGAKSRPKQGSKQGHKQGPEHGPKQGIDQRLNRQACIKVMEKLWKQCLDKTGNRLRDALGCFYNMSQGLNNGQYFVSPVNVHFVNAVFSEYIQLSGNEKKRQFDLDLIENLQSHSKPNSWKNIVKKDCSTCIDPINEVVEKNKNKNIRVDPLLFIALMKRESGFDSRAVSSVGAVGLLQIMPQTGIDLGMKKIFKPEYFNHAISVKDKERKKRKEAIKTLFMITEKKRWTYARKARDLMQQSLKLKKKKLQLFEKYKKDLLKSNKDDRLQPEKAIIYGYAYFSKLLQKYKGDMSLALAAYNAGPHRVEQYNGMPPYSETVKFRNTVMKYYREYLEKAGRSS